MRILVHDFAGHPFQIQLSRELSRRGHTVVHAYCASVEGSKGAVDPLADDPAGFLIAPVSLESAFAKYSGMKRFRQERVYGRLVGDLVKQHRPEAVLSANTPLFAQHQLQKAALADGARFVFWQQDVVGVAMQRILARKIPLAGRRIGSVFPKLERTLVSRSDAVVVITDDFRPLLRSWGVADDRIHTVPNWAPLDEIQAISRDNAWSAEMGLEGKTVLLYAGTLGLKHDPSLLLDLARSCKDQEEVVVVVVSEGLGADWLRERLRAEPLSNLKLLPYQPYERLSQVLATGDVLLVLLEPDAGVFSVPSKVLSYLCAGRPVLGAMPSENLAARILTESGAGISFSPSERASFIAGSRDLIRDAVRRREMAEAGRSFALSEFDILKIADLFEQLLGPRMDSQTAGHATT